jgi:hypothetical protein
MSSYNPQLTLDKINSQIAELERLRNQIPQPPVAQPTNLTQNFQISPTNRDLIKYASSIDEVQKEMVTGDTPFFSKDMSVVWIKNSKGEIKTYELNEIVAKDEKDIQIEVLKARIDELERKIKDEPSNEYVVKSTEDEKPTIISTSTKFSKKSK